MTISHSKGSGQPMTGLPENTWGNDTVKSGGVPGGRTWRSFSDVLQAPLVDSPASRSKGCPRPCG